MVETILVKYLIGISFLFFGFNLVYIIIKKVKGKNNSGNEFNDPMDNIHKPRLVSRLGVMIMNIFITLCFLNIFFYDWFKSIIPRILVFPIDLPVKLIGFCLVLFGNVMLFFAYRELGALWVYPIAGGKKAKRIVDTGIYSKVRHPIYLSFNIFSIGFNLILLDWVLLFLYIFGGIGLYLLTFDEERILISSFKDEYLEYMEKTGRFFPKLF